MIIGWDFNCNTLKFEEVRGDSFKFANKEIYLESTNMIHSEFLKIPVQVNAS